jgi:hypothetical protein
MWAVQTAGRALEWVRYGLMMEDQRQAWSFADFGGFVGLRLQCYQSTNGSLIELPHQLLEVQAQALIQSLLSQSSDSRGYGHNPGCELRLALNGLVPRAGHEFE